MNKVKNTIKIIQKNILLILKFVTKIVESNLINKIAAYSPKNKRAKLEELYSVLKPDTNSDSPSAKSKGVRWLSLKQIINHKIPNGYNKNIIDISL